MIKNVLDKRSEFRFQLNSKLDRYIFAIGVHYVAVEPTDVSRNGMGLILDTHLENDKEVTLKVLSPDWRHPIILHVRFRISERDATNMLVRTRCGVELSDKDKNRGIDLVALLRGSNSFCGSKSDQKPDTDSQTA